MRHIISLNNYVGHMLAAERYQHCHTENTTAIGSGINK